MQGIGFGSQIEVQLALYLFFLLPKHWLQNAEKGSKNARFYSKHMLEWDKILPKLNIFALPSH